MIETRRLKNFVIFLNLFLPDTYMINDCVSITKILMMGVKLMTGRYKKKYSHKK